MARRVLPLTDTQIKAAKPSGKKKLFDGNGLFLLVSDSGSKLWRFRYKRPYTNKDTSLSFGRYPEVSLAEARKKC